MCTRAERLACANDSWTGDKKTKIAVIDQWLIHWVCERTRERIYTSPVLFLLVYLWGSGSGRSIRFSLILLLAGMPL